MHSAVACAAACRDLILLRNQPVNGWLTGYCGSPRVHGSHLVSPWWIACEAPGRLPPDRGLSNLNLACCAAMVSHRPGLLWGQTRKSKTQSGNVRFTPQRSPTERPFARSEKCHKRPSYLTALASFKPFGCLPSQDGGVREHPNSRSVLNPIFRPSDPRLT